MTRISVINGDDITVIIPTAGKRLFALKRAIDSVIAQTEKCSKIIVIWDCKKINQEFLTSYPMVTFLATEIENSGVASARNLGLNNAATSYVALLDDDDYWPVDKIEKYLEVMNSYEQTGFYVSKSSYIDEEGKLVSICPKKRIQKSSSLSKYLNSRILPGRKRITLATSSYVFPRVGPQGVFRFDESAKFAEDILMLYDLEKFFPFRIIPGKPLCFTSLYRRSKFNLSHRPVTFETWQEDHLEKFSFLPKRYFDNTRCYFGAIHLMDDSKCQIKKRVFINEVLTSDADFTTKLSSIFLIIAFAVKILSARALVKIISILRYLKK